MGAPHALYLVLKRHVPRELDGIAEIDEPVTVVKTRGGVVDLGVWIPARISVGFTVLESHMEGDVSVIDKVDLMSVDLMSTGKPKKRGVS